MTENTRAYSLSLIFDGWAGYNTSLVHAIEPLTAEQLTWRPAPGLRSVGEAARHIAFGRLGWFMRMDAPGSRELVARIDAWQVDSDGNRHVDEAAFAIVEQPEELVAWLQATWGMIDKTLSEWTAADLARTYRHTFAGVAYDVSRQWTIWRIMAHDIHHGGQLSTMLGIQGIEAFELIGLGGHIVAPPTAGPDGASAEPG